MLVDPLYTVYRCKSKTSVDRKGPVHYSDDASYTICGKPVDSNWFILTNDHQGEANCQKCVTVVSQRKEYL